jgi:taurine dioxygenase
MGDREPGSAAPRVIPTGTVGADVIGVDLGALTEADVEAIQRAWYEQDVLVFRGQRLTDADLLAFTRRLGTIDPPRPQGTRPHGSPAGHPDIFVVSNVLDESGEPIGDLGHGEVYWHTDMSYRPCPPAGSIAYAVDVPASGGDTWFCGMRAALSALPRPLLARIAGLDIEHDGSVDAAGRVRQGMSASGPGRSDAVTHPIVIEHPVSGAKALYLGRRANARVVGLDLAASDQLLDELWSYATAAVHRHVWSRGDLVLWDNRTTMHRRDAFDPGARRVLHRTQLAGSPPRRATFAIETERCRGVE